MNYMFNSQEEIWFWLISGSAIKNVYTNQTFCLLGNMLFNEHTEKADKPQISSYTNWVKVL